MKRKGRSGWCLLFAVLIVFAMIVGVCAACDDTNGTPTKVVFIVDGNEYEIIETNNGEVIAPIAPDKEGRRFEGWYFDKDGKVGFSVDGLKKRLSEKEVYVYAVYSGKEEELYVIFNVDGKEYSRSKIDRYSGIEMPEKDPSKNGYEFLGWYYDTDGKEQFDVEDVIADNIEKDITIYAVFYENEYKITYKVEGEIYKESKFTVTTLGSLFMPEEPRKSGFTFAHWKDENGDKFEISTYISIGILENVEVEAVFEAIRYSVDLYDGLNLVKSVEIMGDDELILEALDDIKGYNFSGWYIDSAKEEPFDLDKYNNDIELREINVSLYAKFLENVTTVTLIDGNTIIDEIMVDGDCVIKMIEAPEKKGYIFKHWYTVNVDGEKEIFNAHEYAETISRKDISVYAEYEEITTKITFVLDGEEYKKISVGAVKIDEKDLPDPTDELDKKGYDFLGWYKDKELTTPFDIESYQNDSRRKDISVYAKTAEKEYRIVYMINRKEYISLALKHHEKFSLIENVDVTGYEFCDWYVDEDFEEVFSVEKFDNERRDITLYGKLSERRYDVKFIAEGNEIGKGEYSHFDSDIDMPSPPSILGKTFSHWSEDSEGVGIFDKDEYFSGEERRELILYAIYSDIYTNIVFIVNNKTYKEINLKYGEKLTDLFDAPNSAGYDFVCWSLSPSEIIVFDIEEFNSLSEREDLVLYAVYEEKVYTAKFYLGDDLIGSTKYRYSDKYITLITPPKVYGKEFSYWSYDSDGYSRFELDEFMSMSEKYSVVLYAQYEDIYVSVVFKIDGNTDNVIRVKYGEEFSLGTPEKDECNFVGWYCDENFSEAFDMETFLLSPSDIILYARFTKNVGEYVSGGYTITYKVLEGNALRIDTVAETAGAIEESLETLVIPSKITIDGDIYNVREMRSYSVNSLINLKNLVIERGITTVEMFLISDCDSLEKVYFPSTLTNVPSMVFAMASSDLTIYIDGTEESISTWDPEWNNVNGTILKVEYGWQIVPTTTARNFQDI